MNRISKGELREGMILGEDIIAPGGYVLLSEGTKLTNKLLNRISDLPMEDILISPSKIDHVVTKIINKGIINLEHSICFVKNQHIKKEVDEKFDELTKVAKKGILNLNIPCSKILENTNEVEQIIRDNFTKNTLLVFECILNTKKLDKYLYRHSINVCTISFLIGKWLGYSDVEQSLLVKSALLHDIGKLKISEDILNKPDRLTEDEFKEIQKHTEYGYEILKDFKSLDNSVINVALKHHERIDGSGYPLGVKGEEINEFTRIVSIADIFDAMTTDRVYKEKISPFKVAEMFESNSWGNLDFKIVKKFTQKFISFYIGADVLLNTGEMGQILKINLNETGKPLVMLKCGKTVDLSVNRTIEIDEVVISK